eukprot:UN02925
MQTPAHIVPEWYFLPFYAILRAIPNKAWGVVAMGFAIAFFFMMPTIGNSQVYKGNKKIIQNIKLQLKWPSGVSLQTHYY